MERGRNSLKARLTPPERSVGLADGQGSINSTRGNAPGKKHPTPLPRRLKCCGSLLLLLLSPILLFSQEMLRFRVIPDKEAAYVPVPVALDGIQLNQDTGRVALFEITGKVEREVPCQVETGVSPRLWFMFDNAGPEKKYVLKKVFDNITREDNLSFHNSGQASTIQKNGKPVLSYHHGVMLPPEGVDARFKRSGFIHPLWSPGGEVLTRVQAPDHYHHYGIWNPWTETTIDGKKVDFWNLLKGEGTVRFAGYLGEEAGAVYAGFRVHQEHVYFPAKDQEKLAINELWDVRVWNLPMPRISVVDLTTTLNTPLPAGMMLEAYRYGGGIGYRATGKWNNANSTVLTSGGKTRAEADGTNARWCLVEGESSVPEGRSGILFMSHPSNRKHPEPMRVWPVDMNGRGDLYFEFCPTRHESWKLEPLKNYTLKYRMIVFDGKISPSEAEAWWKGFAASPEIIMK